MASRTYYNTAVVIFSAIAAVHFLRVVYGWEAVIGGWPVPMWISWLAVIIAGLMAWHGWRLGRK